MPEIEILGQAQLEVVEEYKVLGLMITTDLKWNSHVKFICQRGYSKLWMLRRLKKLGASTKILIDMYFKHVRSILEYASPAWGSLLTAENCEEIERVQKSAFYIIFGPNSYEKTLRNTKILSPAERRSVLAKKFAQKCATSPVFSQWFQKKGEHCQH